MPGSRDLTIFRFADIPRAQNILPRRRTVAQRVKRLVDWLCVSTNLFRSLKADQLELLFGADCRRYSSKVDSDNVIVLIIESLYIRTRSSAPLSPSDVSPELPHRIKYCSARRLSWYSHTILSGIDSKTAWRRLNELEPIVKYNARAIPASSRPIPYAATDVHYRCAQAPIQNHAITISVGESVLRRKQSRSGLRVEISASDWRQVHLAPVVRGRYPGPIINFFLAAPLVGVSRPTRGFILLQPLLQSQLDEFSNGDESVNNLISWLIVEAAPGKRTVYELGIRLFDLSVTFLVKTIVNEHG
ncbi:hypothetical protein C8J56DRAFT_1025789 [Mycena floridula]|nr:hypothetical protein C8J56DRAFT_1025789 [Mycena floridula]